jgi:hypothetical protein
MTLLEILAIVLALVVAFSIVYSTLKTGISPMMSSNKACQAMIDMVQLPQDKPLIDLGSGWGTLVIAVAKKYPHQQVIGYELSWFPWIVSVARKYFLGLDNLTLYRKDFTKADLSSGSVLFCYLFPQGMVTLHEKLEAELSCETYIVSSTFALPKTKPTKTIKLNDIYQTNIYKYHWQPTQDLN